MEIFIYLMSLSDDFPPTKSPEFEITLALGLFSPMKNESKSSGFESSVTQELVRWKKPLKHVVKIESTNTWHKNNVVYLKSSSRSETVNKLEPRDRVELRPELSKAEPAPYKFAVSSVPTE